MLIINNRINFMSENKIYIGTSGWSFDWDHLVEEKIPKSKKLQYFSNYFDAVEVNYSFYRLPEAKTFKKWQAQTSGEFFFAVKLSRYITHIKRLKRVKTPLGEFLRRYAKLGSKAGPVLLQLPPTLKKDSRLLEKFLSDANSAAGKAGIASSRFAFEFRHESWFEDIEETEKILREYNACWVFADSSAYPYPDREPVTSNQFVYFRMHGPGKLFASEYGSAKLRKWLDKFEDHRKKRDVFVFFNNDEQNHAGKDALMLKQLVDKN